MSAGNVTLSNVSPRGQVPQGCLRVGQLHLLCTHSIKPVVSDPSHRPNRDDCYHVADQKAKLGAKRLKEAKHNLALLLQCDNTSGLVLCELCTPQIHTQPGPQPVAVHRPKCSSS